MSKVAIQGDASGTGTFTIASPNSNNNRTLTLPDNTGTVVTTGSTAAVSQAMLAAGVAGNGPAFSASRITSNQSISASTWTKVQFQSEEFDTNNNYDPTTNYRFTPTVAGYYQINLSCNISYASAAPNTMAAAIYKNGSVNKQSTMASAGGSATGPYGSVLVIAVIYLNGSTDYIEGYAWSNSATAVVVAGSDYSYMSGALVRAA